MSSYLSLQKYSIKFNIYIYVFYLLNADQCQGKKNQEWEWEECEKQRGGRSCDTPYPRIVGSCALKYSRKRKWGERVKMKKQRANP